MRLLFKSTGADLGSRGFVPFGVNGAGGVAIGGAVLGGPVHLQPIYCFVFRTIYQQQQAFVLCAGINMLFAWFRI